MAIIVPKYQSTQRLPSQIGSPLSVPQTFSTRAVGEAARQLEEVTERMRIARQKTALSNAQTHLFKSLVEIENDFQNRTDYPNFESEYKKRVQDLQEHYQGTIQDQEVLEAFRPDFERMTTKSLVGIRSLARRQEIDSGRADFARNYDTYMETITSDQDPEKRYEALNLAKLGVAGSVSAGYIKKEEGEQRLEALNYTALRTNAWQYSKSMGYEAGIDWLINEENAYGLDKNDRDAMVVDLRREWNNEIQAAEKAERDAANARKLQIEDNDFNAWQMFYNDQLSSSVLEFMAKNRNISQETYKAIHEKFQKKLHPGEDDVENNPFIVGELAERIEMGHDVRTDLDEAARKGQIKTSTYLTLRTKIADKEYGEGVAYVVNALKPTQMDQWSPDKNIRFAEAVDRFNELVDKKRPPLEAAKEVVESYTSELRRTFKGLRNPVHLPPRGKKDSFSDLEAAEDEAVKAWREEKISLEEYREEIRLIHELKQLAMERQDLNDLDDEFKKRKGR
jgi:hypothetical protein